MRNPSALRASRLARRYLAAASPRHVYHVTFLHSLDSIASKGLRPGGGQTFGGGYGGHSTGRVFFTEWDGVRFWMDRYEQMAHHHTDNPEDGWVPVVLKIDTRGLDLQQDPAGSRDAFADAYYVEEPVSAGQIKVWHNGWESLSSADPEAMQDEVMEAAEVEEDDGEQWYEVDFEMFQPQRKASPSRVAAAWLRKAYSSPEALVDAFEKRVERLIDEYGLIIETGDRDMMRGLGEVFGEWFDSIFDRIHVPTTPRGGKETKTQASRFLWSAKHRVPMSKDREAGLESLRREWEQFKPFVPSLVRLFSDVGASAAGKEPPIREYKGQHATYLNERGLANKTFMKYVKALDGLFGSLRGWRKKALGGNLTVVLAGPDQFRGRSAGRYQREGDRMLVRATPNILKRTGGTYGAADYILIHELGHRYENRQKPHTDFDSMTWWTTPYSRTESFAGSEGFAELFALGHFGITRHGSLDFADVVQRFEEIMR